MPDLFFKAVHGASQDATASLDHSGVLIRGSHSDHNAGSIREWLSFGTKYAAFAIHYQVLEWSEDRDPTCENGRARALGGSIHTSLESP
eukprot:9477758-Pyramimonas_sp.AAC.1